MSQGHKFKDVKGYTLPVIQQLVRCIDLRQKHDLRDVAISMRYAANSKAQDFDKFLKTLE